MAEGYGTSPPGRMWSFIVIVVCVVITVTCLIVEIWVSIGVLSPRAEQSPQHERQLCIDCNAVIKNLEGADHEHLIKKLPVREKDGVKKFCADNTLHLSTFMELLTLKSQKKSRPLMTYELRNVTVDHVSAHRRLVKPADVHDSLEGEAPHFLDDRYVDLNLDANSADPEQEHAQNVEVMTSGYHVLYSGLYYVYSSIYFGPESSKPCKSFKQQTWRQSVVLSRPGDPLRSGALLTAAHSCCDNCTREKETSYTGGIFVLNAGDLLHVEVSGSGLVVFQRESSFFGLGLAGSLSP